LDSRGSERKLGEPLENPGLYVHVPFCKTKCPYCGFYSVVSTASVPRWLNALREEIRRYENQFGCFDTLYLGGGTPTSLRTEDLETIVASLFTSFRFAEETEMTIEANPGDLTREKARQLRALGFNRVNVGVQSFDDETLRFLGRRHSAREAESSLLAARSAEFGNLGMDLIYGSEVQSLKKWIETLKRSLEFFPEHLSCYELTVEKNTPFWKMKTRGILKPMEEEEAQAFFVTTSQFLEHRGYIHYEVSNFAKTGAHTSRHNQKYWSRAPYLGIGPSAHSFLSGKRWWNWSSVRRYCECLEDGSLPVAGCEQLTEEQEALEWISLGFRTKEGFELRESFADSKMMDVLSMLREKGLCRVENGRVMPTRSGFLVADRLPFFLL